MKIIFSGSILSLTLFISCSKNTGTNSYNYNINTTNPASLPSGTLVVDINGVTTYFDSAVSSDILYHQIGSSSDTSYNIEFSGYSHQPGQKYTSLSISLLGYLPFDTTSFYLINRGGLANLFSMAYYTYSAGYKDGYGFYHSPDRDYQASLTYVDDSTFQGIFSGYLPPYNLTNGAFNLKK